MPADSKKRFDVLLVIFAAVALGGLAMLFMKFQSRSAAAPSVGAVEPVAEDAAAASATAAPTPTPTPMPPVQAVVAPPPQAATLPPPPKAVPPAEKVMMAHPPQIPPPAGIHHYAHAKTISPGTIAGAAAGAVAPAPPPPPPPGPPAIQVPTAAAVAPVPPPPPPVEDDATKLDQALANLKPGNLAYSTPTQMKLGETQQVVAKIATDAVSAAALAAGLPADAGAQVATATTSITPKMKMTLTSADFDITAMSSEEQLVAGSVPTTWEWGIVPKHSGDLQLHLAATIELDGLEKDFTTVDREIAVKVDPADAVGDFVKENWQWIIATLTGLVGAVVRYLNGRKKKAEVAA